MNKDFAPYQPSLDMKGLGFDEPCFGCYDEKRVFGLTVMSIKQYYTNNKEDTWNCSAPTFSQAFRWFREKYRLDGHVTFRESPTNKIEGINSVYYNIEIYTLMSGDAYKTYNFKEISDKKEEAELACLIKLIEIVKGGQDGC